LEKKQAQKEYIMETKNHIEDKIQENIDHLLNHLVPVMDREYLQNRVMWDALYWWIKEVGWPFALSMHIALTTEDGKDEGLLVSLHGIKNLCRKYVPHASYNAATFGHKPKRLPFRIPSCRLFAWLSAETVQNEELCKGDCATFISKVDFQRYADNYERKYFVDQVFEIDDMSKFYLRRTPIKNEAKRPTITHCAAGHSLPPSIKSKKGIYWTEIYNYALQPIETSYAKTQILQLGWKWELQAIKKRAPNNKGNYKRRRKTGNSNVKTNKKRRKKRFS
jgi:hypothetical protein